jgi:hypothetical protein
MIKFKEFMLNFGIVSTFATLLALGIYGTPSRVVDSESVKTSKIEETIYKNLFLFF